jgi:hypothetical protein
MVYKISQWAENERGWGTDTGNPGIMLVANAVQAWSLFQEGGVTVAQAARVFNLDAKDIRAAVEAHPWMFLHGGNEDDDSTYIEHDGE